MNTKNNISIFDKCSNCGACLNVCPTRAIYINSDGLFYEPKVRESECVGCGKCINVCPVNNNSVGLGVISATWGYHKDKEIVEKSSSGGVFFALANSILSNGGVVFAAGFDKDSRTVKIYCTDEIPLEKLLRSKYTESLVGDSFKKAKEYLDKGKKVLFCATPCQISGLKKYLGHDYDDLYTCDFACGGLSSHRLYNKYLDFLEGKYKSKVSKVNFRPKIYGWNIHAIKVDFENGQKYTMPAIVDPYFSGFIAKHVNTREYCYSCDFSENHVSDLILADFWKMGSIVPEEKNNTGVSLILVNSEKGEQLLKNSGNTLALKKLDTDVASYNLKKRTYSKDYMNLRKEYLSVCEKQGLEEAMKLINSSSKVQRMLTKLKYTLKGLAVRFK